MGSVSNINDLPPEILSHIASFLAPQATICAALTCKKWMSAVSYSYNAAPRWGITSRFIQLMLTYPISKNEFLEFVKHFRIEKGKDVLCGFGDICGPRDPVHELEVVKINQWINGTFSTKKNSHSSGNIQMVRWMVETFRLTAQEMIESEGFSRACANGSLDVAKLIAKICADQGVQIALNDFIPFQTACELGHLDALKWMVPKFCISQLSICQSDCFSIVCREGRLDIANWLTKTFGLVNALTVDCKYNALLKACTSGHLEVVKWLTITFQLAPGEARWEQISALSKVCELGNLDIAKWLVNAFNLTTGDIIKARALYYACSRASFELIVWLLRRFNNILYYWPLIIAIIEFQPRSKDKKHSRLHNCIRMLDAIKNAIGKSDARGCQKIIISQAARARECRQAVNKVLEMFGLLVQP